MHMGMMLIITSHFTQNYDKVIHRTLNASKGQKGKGATNKGLATKLAQGQPNTMEASHKHGSLSEIYYIWAREG